MRYALVVILIFARTNQALADSAYTLVAVGDIMLGNKMPPFLKKHGPDYPFKNVTSIISAADVAIGNLEAPFGTEGVADTSKTYSFLVPPAYAEGVKNAGFDVLCLANNHTMDFGAVALTSTIQTLQTLGLKPSGAGQNSSKARQAVIQEVGNVKLAFLSYSATHPASFYAGHGKTGTAQATAEHIENDVRQAKQQADLVIVSFHWGEELRDTPKDYQMVFGHLAIDCGAALVLGHHPHILQGLDVYNGGLIAYSLGNFTFGSYSPNAKTSVILKVSFDKTGLKKAELIPLNVDNFKVHFQTRIETGTAAGKILKELDRLSKPLGTTIRIENERGYLDF